MEALNTGSGTRSKTAGPRMPGPSGQLSAEHYLRLILHRKWLILATFVVVTAVTAAVAWRMPDLYTSSTVILVDPQKVPESYVRPTVTGDIRNRLGTLEQQILSATRLQKIIDEFNLYPLERQKHVAREDIISQMRKDISVGGISDFGSSQELQAFRISYSGREPRLVARVTTELAGLFIEENLKAREQQAAGTTEFLENQLQQTRKDLETQEAKLRDFRMKHIGEMPEQQSADLQILGQVQSQLQLEGEALNRAQQQKALTESMASQSAPVVDFDDGVVKGPTAAALPGAPAAKGVASLSVKAKLQAQLKEKLDRGYTEAHPDIKRLRAEIAEEEAKEAKQTAAGEVKVPVPPPYVGKKQAAPAAAPQTAETARKNVPGTITNPVLISQLKSLNAEIEKHTAEMQRLNKLAASYQTKLEAIPVREQEIADLVRDYEISKAHYSQLLSNQLSAETATQLELRQKGEKFTVLDAAQPAEKPSKPNRKIIDAAGAFGGLALGLFLALITEFLGISITSPDQLLETTGIPVLEVIPLIETTLGRRLRKRRMVWALASCVLLTVVTSCSFLLYRYWHLN